MVSIKALALLAIFRTVFADDSVTDAEISSINTVKTTNFGTTIGSSCACGILSILHRDKVFFPGSATYTNETTYYWDLKETLAPKCVFVPSNSHDVAKGVFTFNVCKSQFAVRGGGHMPIKGSANTDGGVLLALTKFRSNVVSADRKTVASGSGQGWVEVYQALEPYGLYAIGGRLKTIGVGGLTLGGGINYFGTKYGFTMDTVVSFEIVLSSGKVVVASATSHPDLYWALKGSSNNLGVVTKFTFKVYNIPKVSGAVVAYSEAQIPAFAQAVADLAKYQTPDLVGGGFFTMVYVPSTERTTVSATGIEASTISPPPTFANFTRIPSLFSSYVVSSPLQWHNAFDTPYQVQRRLFGVRSMRPDGVQMAKMYSIYKSAVQEIRDVAGLNCVLVFQPITTSMTSVAKTNGVGNVLDIDNKEPYVWWQINAFWDNVADDARVEAWAINIREKIHALNKELGLATEHLYLNDCGGDQKPFATIPAANLARLKTVRARYDPTLAFTKLVTGGFKF